jgi:hypothetical protein
MLIDRQAALLLRGNFRMADDTTVVGKLNLMRAFDDVELRSFCTRNRAFAPSRRD